jgi:hypothetical protein
MSIVGGTFSQLNRTMNFLKKSSRPSKGVSRALGWATRIPVQICQRRQVTVPSQMRVSNSPPAPSLLPGARGNAAKSKPQWA